VLAGTWGPERTRLLPDSRLDALGARLVLGRRAVDLDVSSRAVTADDGSEYRYDALVISTGVAARRLPGPDLPGVFTLRTLDDALALRGVLNPQSRLVVVGAGFLGLEAAATARGLGASVTVIEPLDRPLASRLGEELAGRLLALHKRNGVDIRTGVGVAGLVGTTAVRAVELSDGNSLPTDVVLIAIGSVPRTEWLHGSGLTIQDGVLCDQYCSAAERVWAAGDVARWLHADVGDYVRIEHRTNASEQGAAVARAILGERVPFDPVPFFWTDHYDVRIQMAGIICDEPQIAIGRGGGERSFVELFHDGPKLTGAVGWNAPREIAERRRLFDSQRFSRLPTARAAPSRA
jgi:3-phenylpropionate/trans-cinnamate dioxygenase ferredoxin reductase component